MAAPENVIQPTPILELSFHITDVCDVYVTDIIFVVLAAVAAGFLQAKYKQHFMTIAPADPTDKEWKAQLGGAVWKWIMAMFLTAWGLGALSKWDFTETSAMWAGWPQHMGRTAKYFIMSEMAFRSQALFILLKYKKMIREFKMYLLHHVSLLICICVSYSMRWHRCALLILILHTAADIPFYFARTMHYLQLEFPADLTFIVFALSMVLTRIVLFPVIIYSIWFELPQYLAFSSQAWSLFFGCLLLLLSNLIWLRYTVLNGIRGIISKRRESLIESPAKKRE